MNCSTQKNIHPIFLVLLWLCVSLNTSCASSERVASPTLDKDKFIISGTPICDYVEMDTFYGLYRSQSSIRGKDLLSLVSSEIYDEVAQRNADAVINLHFEQNEAALYETPTIEYRGTAIKFLDENCKN